MQRAKLPKLKIVHEDEPASPMASNGSATDGFQVSKKFFKLRKKGAIFVRFMLTQHNLFYNLLLLCLKKKRILQQNLA